MRKHLPVLGPQAGELGDAGFGWRHLATLLLLLVTLPIFVAAGAVALVVLPFVIAAVGIEQIRRVVDSQLQPAPARIQR